MLRPSSLELVGSLAESTFNHVNIGTAVVGADGLSADGGLTTHDEIEARTNAAMIARAQRVIAACDSSKIGATTLAKMIDLGDLDILVTDSDIAPDQLAAIRATGVDVQIVEAPRG